jgi:hypothetical protein
MNPCPEATNRKREEVIRKQQIEWIHGLTLYGLNRGWPGSRPTCSHSSRSTISPHPIPPSTSWSSLFASVAPTQHDSALSTPWPSFDSGPRAPRDPHHHGLRFFLREPRDPLLRATSISARWARVRRQWGWGWGMAEWGPHEIIDEIAVPLRRGTAFVLTLSAGIVSPLDRDPTRQTCAHAVRPDGAQAVIRLCVLAIGFIYI